MDWEWDKLNAGVDARRLTAAGQLTAEMIYNAFGFVAPLQRGDRVRIKEGYAGEGEVYYYFGKSHDDADKVWVSLPDPEMVRVHNSVYLADAIEPYPYTREERIERAIEDCHDLASAHRQNYVDMADESDTFDAVLFAILDAGI